MADMRTFVREPLLDDLSIRKIKGEIDLSGNVSCLVVIALDKTFNKLELGHVGTLVKYEIDASDRTTLPHHEHAGGRYCLLAKEAYCIHGDVRRKKHLLTVVKGIYRLKAMLDALGLLEVKG